MFIIVLVSRALRGNALWVKKSNKLMVIPGLNGPEKCKEKMYHGNGGVWQIPLADGVRLT